MSMPKEADNFIGMREFDRNYHPSYYNANVNLSQRRYIMARSGHGCVVPYQL